MKNGEIINVDYMTMMLPLVGRIVDMELGGEMQTFKIVGCDENVQLMRVSKEIKN